MPVPSVATVWTPHNRPPEQWVSAIGTFTIVFAVGPRGGRSVVGWVAGGFGLAARGLVVSAVSLWLGSAQALCQRPLAA